MCQYSMQKVGKHTSIPAPGWSLEAARMRITRSHQESEVIGRDRRTCFRAPGIDTVPPNLV